MRILWCRCNCTWVDTALGSGPHVVGLGLGVVQHLNVLLPPMGPFYSHPSCRAAPESGMVKRSEYDDTKVRRGMSLY